MKYIACKRAFYNNHMVEVGEEIEAPEGFKAKWVVSADVYVPPEVPVVNEPTTFSEMAKADRNTPTFVELMERKRPGRKPGHGKQQDNS